MKQVFLSTTTEFKEIDTLEPGTWINLVNPTQNESLEIANTFDIDIADLRAPLDADGEDDCPKQTANGNHN